MASNPNHHDYTVVFASPTAAPTRIGEHATLQSTTYPGLLHAAGWTTGLHDAWRTGWTYPACAGKPHLTGLTGPQAHRYILTGSKDASHVDTYLSPIAPRYIQGLAAAQTQLHVEVTGHDNIVPYAHQLEYVDRLLAQGLPVHVDVLLRAGHSGRTEVGPLGPANVRINRLIDALLPHLTQAAPYKVTPGVTYYRVNRTSESLDRLALPDGKRPFTMEAPYVTVRGQRFPVVFVGHPGTEYRLDILYKGQVVATLAGTIPQHLKRIHWIDVPDTQQTGTYVYALRIRKGPGQPWKTIPKTNTPTGDAAIVKVFETEPSFGADAACNAAKPPHLPGYPATNWGLSEY